MEYFTLNSICGGAARLLIVGALALGGTFCSKVVPVQELNEARMQIAEAEAAEAEEYAPQAFTRAREALLSAHQSLGEEEYDEARAQALQAGTLAMNARSEAAPQLVAGRQLKARKSLTAAEDAYAEVLAAQDFAAAQALYKEGEGSKSDAELKASQAGSGANLNLAAQQAALESYSTAARKFADADTAANRAKNVALAQKDDMFDSLDGIRANLARAERWGADTDEINELAAARATLSKAEGEINAGKLKQGNATMQEAQEASRELLARVAARYASEKLIEADNSVAKAKNDYSGVNTPANQQNAESKDLLETIGAQLTAAEEASESAGELFKENKMEESINESEDAIRLSQIIFEQNNLLLAARERNATEIGEGSGDQNAENNETAGREGWSKYTVKRQRPADCLWCIAKRSDVYGNGRLWSRIYQANKSTIKNPNRIYPGQKLWIPPRSGSIVRPEPAQPAPLNSTETEVEAVVDEAMPEDAEAEEQPAESVE